MSMEAIHIMTTCTNRKKLPVSRQLRLSNVQGRDIPARAQQWIRRLETTSQPRRAARDLYAGELWAGALQLAPRAASQGLAPKEWVLSAGYGLISPDALLLPYGATFSPNSDDSVGRGASRPDAEREWWRQLAAWDGPKTGAPRTIEELARRSPQAKIMVVAAPPYVQAIADDLVAARENLSDSGGLLIVTSRLTIPDALADCLVVTEQALAHRLGGSCIGLNVRVAGDILDNIHRRPLNAPKLRAHYRRLAQSTPKKARLDKPKATDADVARFLRLRRKVEATASRSRLHTEFRKQFQCSQERFKTVFDREVSRGRI